MKKLLSLAALVMFASFLPMDGVQARSSNQGKHLDNNPPYDCNVTKDPAAPKWVDIRHKKEAIGNGRIELIWEDSDRAHEVEIKYGRIGGSTKEKDAADDGDSTFISLRNGSQYWFKVRGVSNCGKSSWTEAKNTIIIGKPNRFLP